MPAMLAVLSPAKKLDFETPIPELPTTTPLLLAETRQLHTVVKKLSPEALGALMDLSAELAELNWDRFVAWKASHDPAHANPLCPLKPAILAFAGDVYTGLDAPSLTVDDLVFAQDHVAILSGFYGVLRALDWMRPYRLEMGSRLANKRGKDLYAFWGDRIGRTLAGLLEGHADRTLVNLASNEYFKAVTPEALPGKVLTLQFKEVKGGVPTALMLFVKRARGLMARFMVTERVDRPRGLQDFRLGDYRFDKKLSTATDWVFTRPYRTAAMAGLDEGA